MLNNNYKNYDLAIIGGGPAGLITGLNCAQAGLKVVIFERDREIGKPVRCAEGVMAKTITKFQDLPDNCIASVVNKVQIIPPNQRPIKLNTPHGGLILHRDRFEKYLAEKAIQAGAYILVNHDVVNVTYEIKSQEFSVETRNKNEIIKSRILVGADGIDSLVGRWFNMTNQLSLREIFSCAQYLLHDTKINDDECMFIFDTDYAPGGYVWVFPKGENIANVGLGLNPLYAKKCAKTYLDDFVRDKYPASNALRFTCGAVPSTYTNRTLVKNRVMLVGDCAFQANAISGGGIDLAITAGEMCSHAIIKACEGKEIKDKCLKNYETKWHKKFDNKEKIEEIFKTKIMKASNKDFNRYFDYIRDLDGDKMNTISIFKSLIIKKPKLFAKISKEMFFDYLK